MGLGLSGATCNGSVIPDALLGVRDDGDVGAIWSPLSGGLLCRVVMVVALADTGFIGGGGLIGGGEIGLCCCCDCCCCCGGWRVERSILVLSPLLELPLSLALVLLLFAADSLLLPDDMVL